MSTVPMFGPTFVTPVSTPELPPQSPETGCSEVSVSSPDATVIAIAGAPSLEDPVQDDEQEIIAVSQANSIALRAADRMIAGKEFHRVREVRIQQGISLRSVARRTGIEVRRLKQQEDPSFNLTLQELQVWQEALEVPISDLLVDSDQPLSQSVQQRAQLVKIMKTAVAIHDVAVAPRIQRLATMLREQLLGLMPELQEVSGWPNYGQRRSADQVGRVAESPIPTSQISFDGGE